MSNIVQKILKRIPLERKISTCIHTMPALWKKNEKEEYEFLLTNEELDTEVNIILKTILEWIDNGMPGLEEIKKYIKNKNMLNLTKFDNQKLEKKVEKRKHRKNSRKYRGQTDKM